MESVPSSSSVKLWCTRTNPLTHCTIISDKETDLNTHAVNTFVLMKMARQTIIDPLSNWSEDDAGSLTFKESPDSSHLSLSVDLLSPVKRTAQGTLNWELPLLSRSLKRQHAEMIKCFLRFAALGPFGVRFNCSNRFVVLAAKQLKSPNLTFKKYCTKISEDWPDLRKYSSHLSKCLQSLVDTV